MPQKSRFYPTDQASGRISYIAFKNNSCGDTRPGIWEKMHAKFTLEREEFLKHYHKRSNVESTFSMIKRKFGDSVRSKTDVAIKNEVLAKVLCHNIVVVIHEMHELGIEPTFVKPPSEIPAVLKFRGWGDRQPRREESPGCHNTRWRISMGSPACPGELVEYTPDPIRGPGYRVTPDGLSVGAPGFPEGWVITCSKNPRDCDTCPRRESMRKESATLENRLNAEFFVIRQEESNLRDLHCSGFVVCDMDDQDREALRRSLCPDGGDS